MDTQRSHTFTWEDPQPHVAAGRRMSGLEYMQQIFRSEMPLPPIAVLMNMRGAEVEEGRLVFEAEPGEMHLNPIGLVHGGFAATILDSAMGCVVHTLLPQGMMYSTIQINIHYVRPVMPGQGVLRCEARALHQGRQMATASAELRDMAGKLYAHGTSACSIFPLPQS